MLSKVKSLAIHGQTNKNELLMVLKEDARKVTLQDIVRCSLQIQQEADCIHTSYKKEYIKAETGFMIRIGEVKNDNINYNGSFDVEELDNAIELLEEQEKMVKDLEYSDPTFVRVYSIISLYTTFIKDEPIHQVGTLFPGGFTVKKEGDKYTCPVKENNKNNPLALCPFCIAEQDEEV
ncbi:MAG: DUF2115 domain-containing protein [Methanobacterium sp. ERen5]|nr:MAG: DUF2115 domain-containing protein [Methanobacterium sp. ERen5]